MPPMITVLFLIMTSRHLLPKIFSHLKHMMISTVQCLKIWYQRQIYHVVTSRRKWLNDRVMPTKMKTIMKMDSPSAKSSALWRPQRGADTCNYGLSKSSYMAELLYMWPLHGLMQSTTMLHCGKSRWLHERVVELWPICIFPKGHWLSIVARYDINSGFVM